MLDRIEALKYAGDVAMAFPGQNVTEDHAGGWASEFMVMSVNEARRVVALITARLMLPPSRAQIRQALDEVRGTTMSPAIESHRCVFADDIECGIHGTIHGHLITAEEAFHGVMHLANHFEGKTGELERAKHPERCDCGVELPSSVDMRNVIETVAKVVTR
jgi:hypothetical protein